MVQSAAVFGQQASKQLFNAMMNPQFYQAWAALSDAGQNPWETMSEFVLSGKGAKKQAKAAPGQYIPMGKGQFVDIGALSAKLPEFKAQALEANTKAAQATYDKLLETPAYATLAAQAKGQFADDYMNAVNKHFGQMASANLGAAATQGFQNDTNKQIAAILPVSEAKSQYLTEAQKAAQSYLQGMAGFGGTSGQSAYALSGLSGPGSYYSPMMNAANMNMQNNQFNAQMQFAQNQANDATKKGYLGMGLGLATYGAGGGFGGGGLFGGGGMFSPSGYGGGGYGFPYGFSSMYSQGIG